MRNFCLGLIFTLISLASNAQRARDPWVFRSVLDGIPRAITFALNSKLWAAYDTKNGALMRLWNGSVTFRGEVYNGEKVYQPTVTGFVYLSENDTLAPYVVYENNSYTRPTRITYLGHIIEGDSAAILYELVNSKGHKVVVKEWPEFYQGANSTVGFQRSWKIVSNPNNLQIGVIVTMPSMPESTSFTTKSKMTFLGKNEIYKGTKTIYSIKAIIELELNNLTVLKHYLATY